MSCTPVGSIVAVLAPGLVELHAELPALQVERGQGPLVELQLLPLLLETSLQAQFVIPMAISVACGVTSGKTFLR